MSVAHLLCRQWFSTRGTCCTVVVAATKEDAAILADARFAAAGFDGTSRPRVRPATEEDVERFQRALVQTQERARLVQEMKAVS